MKSKVKKIGFTIIELLTVMSIIVILISLLVPSLNAVRRYAKVVRQKGQFHDISNGMEMFKIDFDGLPDSSSGGSEGFYYCGAMKLCEAMVGKDGLGFHPDSELISYASAVAKDLYPDPPTSGDPSDDPNYMANLRARKVPYIDVDKFQIVPLEHLYTTTTPFDACDTIICDVFPRTRYWKTGERIGMPVLYYKADTAKLLHDTSDPDNDENIYNFVDNHKLIDPTVCEEDHPLFKSTGTEGQVFYQITKNKKVTTIEKPHNPDSFILISAGWDGLYGTRDDVFNFAK